MVTELSGVQFGLSQTRDTNRTATKFAFWRRFIDDFVPILPLLLLKNSLRFFYSYTGCPKKKYPLLKSGLLLWTCVVIPLGISLCEIVFFIFAALCYLAGREIIPPFMYKSIQFPKVSRRTFKTKGLISIEGSFFWDTLYTYSYLNFYAINGPFALYRVYQKKRNHLIF